MKKTLVIFLTIILLAGITAFALAENKPGDIVTITFKMTNNPGGAWSIQANVDTSDAPVEIVSGSAQVVNWTMAPEGAGNTFGVFSTSGAVSPGTIGSMQFRIKNDAKPGKYFIGMNVTEAADGLGHGVSYPSVSGGVIEIACTHEKTTEKITKKAACTEKGEKQIVCDNCGEVVKTEEIPATGHKWDKGKVTTEPSCETEGVMTYTCENDKKHTKTEKIASLGGHKWDEGKVTTEPTCEGKGVKTFTCQNDASHTKTEDIDPIGHDWGEWVVTTKPVGDTPGEETRVCKNDASHKETRPTICAHENTEEQVTEPTCEEPGEKKLVCLDCGNVLKTEVIMALGPDWDDGEVTTEPTCTEKGVKTFTCRRCGETKTEEIPALGHLWGEEETVEPTCTEEGSITRVCQRCEEPQIEVIPPLGHIAGEWEVIREATEEEDGLRQLKCARCGELLREEILTLNKSDWRYNQTVTTKGIRYRDIKPGLTFRWYMFTPIDLSQDGVQTFDLLAANARRIGSVTVTVQDGKAVVNYRMFKRVDQLDLGFALLPNLDSVTDVEAIDYSRFAFGQEISIQDDLDGDALVLLQVMGHINYNFEDGQYEQFTSAGKDYADYVNELKSLMD